MRALYIKIDYDEALAGKKEFLTAQINMLKLLRSLRNYKNWRRRELILKTRFKTRMTNIKKKLNELKALFPKEAEPVEEEIKTTRQTKEEHEDLKTKSDIEVQLAEIKEQLARLG